MLNHWLVSVCYINVLMCAMQAFPRPEELDPNSFLHNLKDRELHGRMRRGLPAKLHSLLQKATLIYEVKNYQVFGRKGGTGQALKDWKALKPRNVADFGVTKWGDVGDRTVMFDMDDGRVILNILATKTTPDGNVVRIVTRVKYSDNVPNRPFPVSRN